MFRRYNRWHTRFDQPDPYDGSYDLSNPQSLNRYAYVSNDPVNFTDPTGLQAKAGGSCTAGDGQPGIVDGDGKCVTGLREQVTVHAGGVNDGLASLLYARRMLDSFFTQQGPSGPLVDPATFTETPPPLPTPIWCQPDVIKAMERAWQRTTNGMSGNEAGFVLNGSPSNYNIMDTKSGNTRNEQKMTVYGNTFLLFHVHPNSSTRNPSTPENNARGDKNFGDTLISDRFQNQQPPRTILFMVGHKTGLTLYDPRTKQVTVLRNNLDWMKPC
jgi:hypothetical protein